MSHLRDCICEWGTAQYLKVIWKERLCAGFHPVISLSDTLILGSPHSGWARIINPAKKESVFWTAVLSWKMHQANISLPLQTPVWKANKTQLLKQKKRPSAWGLAGHSCVLQLLHPARCSHRYLRVTKTHWGTAGLNVLDKHCLSNGRQWTYQKGSQGRQERWRT